MTGHAERLDQDRGPIRDLVRDGVDLRLVGDHLLRPAAGQIAAEADQHAGGEFAFGRLRTDAGFAARAGTTRFDAPNLTTDQRHDDYPLTGGQSGYKRPGLGHSPDDLVSRRHRERGERHQGGAGPVQDCTHVAATDPAQDRCNPQPIRSGQRFLAGRDLPQSGNRAALEHGQRQPIGRAYREVARQRELVLERPHRRQLMGTWRRILPLMRAKISSRLSPVIVRPWLRSPMTAWPGSGSCRTRSATVSANSKVPPGYLMCVDLIPFIQAWTWRIAPTNVC